MRGALVTLLLVSMPLVGCGGKSEDASAGGDSGVFSFPVGTYPHCAQGVGAADGNTFLNAVGFVPGAVLELSRSGNDVNATYVDENAATSSSAFVAIANTAATLAGADEVTGFTGLCVRGVGVNYEEPFQATLSPSSGTLTVDGGTAFVLLTGTLSGDGGDCGPQASPASLWIICDGGTPSTIEAAPRPVPELPSGDYTCDSQIGTFYASGGQNQYVTSGGDDGRLTLTQTGTLATVTYADDSFISGSLEFGVTTATTANVAMDQSLTTPCLVPITNGGPPPETQETLGVMRGSLALDESTLFVAFDGAMDPSSSCSGAQKMGTLICAPKR